MGGVLSILRSTSSGFGKGTGFSGFFIQTVYFMPQANSTIEDDFQMPENILEVGVRVLRDSGFLEFDSSADRMLVKAIFFAMVQEYRATRLVQEPPVSLL